jgi:hypothetical protein
MPEACSRVGTVNVTLFPDAAPKQSGKVVTKQSKSYTDHQL